MLITSPLRRTLTRQASNSGRVKYSYSLSATRAWNNDRAQRLTSTVVRTGLPPRPTGLHNLVDGPARAFILFSTSAASSNTARLPYPSGRGAWPAPRRSLTSSAGTWAPALHLRARTLLHLPSAPSRRGRTSRSVRFVVIVWRISKTCFPMLCIGAARDFDSESGRPRLAHLASVPSSCA